LKYIRVYGYYIEADWKHNVCGPERKFGSKEISYRFKNLL
jgi:hypothetical protein